MECANARIAAACLHAARVLLRRCLGCCLGADWARLWSPWVLLACCLGTASGTVWVLLGC
eukprot:2629775-Lingulodinium_polyedra.AAC.1